MAPSFIPPPILFQISVSLLLAAGIACAENQATAVTLEDILALLEIGSSSAEILPEIQKRGYRGPSDTESLARLKKAGADVALLLELRRTGALAAVVPAKLPSPSPDWDEITLTAGPLSKFRKDDKWGIINDRGEIILEATRQEGEVWPWTPNKIAYYDDDDGGWVIQTLGGEAVRLDTNFDWLGKASQGMAWFATKDEKQGFIDLEGRVVIPARWNRITSFIEDDLSAFTDDKFAKVGTESGWGVTNQKGEEVVPCEYEGIHVGESWGPFIIVEKGGKSGAYDFQGQLLIAAETYSLLRNGGDHFILTTQESTDTSKPQSTGLYDMVNGVSVPAVWQEVLPLGEGWALLIPWTGDTPRSLYNRRTGSVTKSPWHYLEPFTEGLSAVKAGSDAGESAGKWGFIDPSGKVMIQPRWAQVQSFSNGVAFVTTDVVEITPVGAVYNQMFIPDEPAARPDPLTGEPVGSPKDDTGRYGLIDRTGKVLIDMALTAACKFQNGKAEVKLNGQWGSIDTAGHFRPGS